MTKKIFVAIFLCMASLSICHAQKSTFKQELAVGASFGLNFSSVSFAPKVPTKMKLGFNGGATIRWNTEPNLGIQAELPNMDGKRSLRRNLNINIAVR